MLAAGCSLRRDVRQYGVSGFYSSKQNISAEAQFCIIPIIFMHGFMFTDIPRCGLGTILVNMVEII